MKRALIALILAVGVTAAGCNGPQQAGPAGRADQGPSPVVDEFRVAGILEEADALDLWQELTPPGESGAYCFSAAEAPECPHINVVDPLGRDTRTWPAHEGAVTLIVFWEPEAETSLWALRHVDELVREYRSRRVEGISIVPGRESMDMAYEAARLQHVELPVFGDPSSAALVQMTGALSPGAQGTVPSVFITDRRGRLRFLRPGFSFLLNPHDPKGRVLRENAPPGQSIRDYLKRIAGER